MLRFVRLALVVVFLSLTFPTSTQLPSNLLFTSQSASAAEEEYPFTNGYFFTQTGGGNGRGYSIVNDASAPFWNEFQRLGGVQAVGYPVSRRFLWNGFLCQVMQRVVFQWRPDLGQVAFVNVFDLFSEAGQDDNLFVTRQVPRPLPASFDGGKNFADVIQARLALLDENPAISQKYNSIPGDPISMNGLPTSRVTDMGNHFALRTQRVLFQQWKEAVPWAAAGEVTVALGGSISAELGVFPREILEPELLPGETRPLVNVALPGATPTPPPAPITTLGYGFQLDWSGDYQRALSLTKEAGFNWVKFQARWEQLEPTQGNILWSNVDYIVNAANDAGVKLLFSVVTAPRWARAGQNMAVHGPPNDPNAYANFVSALAKRYKGKIAAYEIWNEQNLDREWGGPSRQSAANYVTLLKAAFQAVKAADPQAKIITGALTPAGNVNIPSLGGLLARDDVEYLQEMYEAGMKGYFDAVAVHPSGFNNAPDLDPLEPDVLARPGSFKQHRSFYFRNYERYREIMVQQGDGDKALWFTEFGWASGCNAGNEWAYANENTEQDQASYLVKAYEVARRSGYVGPMFIWNLNFSGTDEAKCAFAVLNPDGSPRPAFNGLKQMAK